MHEALQCAIFDGARACHACLPLSRVPRFGFEQGLHMPVRTLFHANDDSVSSQPESQHRHDMRRGSEEGEVDEDEDEAGHF